MANDSEEIRWIDRIRAITFREARDAGASFISCSWIAKYIKRDESFVKRNWNKNPYDCHREKSENLGRPEVLSQESKDIIAEAVGRPRKSLRKMALELETKRGKKRSYSAVYRELKKSGIKPFHVISKPNITEQQREDRAWFCGSFLKDWDEADFLHVAASDEFFIYTVRKPNHKNDIIWAANLDDISDDVRYRQVVKFPECLGIFLCFTAKRLMWIIKEKGQSWNGEYFRDTVLTGGVFPFLRDPENVLSVAEVTFLHDKAPCFKALQTQELLRNSGIDFFSSSEFPGSSPDLNVCENVGSILKDRVEERTVNYDGIPSLNDLRREVTEVLREMEFDSQLFCDLLKSYPSRMQAVVQADGGHTKY